MVGNLMHSGAVVLCPHGGNVEMTATSIQVKVSGQPVITSSDSCSVAGCPFQIPAGPTTKPQPCVTVRWTVAAQRVKVNGQPVILSTSAGSCFSAEQIMQGPTQVQSSQFRVQGS